MVIDLGRYDGSGPPLGRKRLEIVPKPCLSILQQRKQIGGMVEPFKVQCHEANACTIAPVCISHDAVQCFALALVRNQTATVPAKRGVTAGENMESSLGSGKMFAVTGRSTHQ